MSNGNSSSNSTSDELDDTAQAWNTHTIRPSKNLNVPSGRPNVMFALPEHYGTRDFLSPIEDYDFQLCKNECIFRQTKPCDPDLYELCNIFMAESNLTLATDSYQAVNLYMHLREAIRACV
ncbi:unnamed protein product [Gadus morhua 'NCC']